MTNKKKLIHILDDWFKKREKCVEAYHRWTDNNGKIHIGIDGLIDLEDLAEYIIAKIG